MEKLVFTSTIHCSLEDLFDFHTDSNNIKQITPKDTKVELLNDDTTTYEGKIVKIKTTKYFIPTYWEVKIETLQKPNILVDVAVKSPFKYWKHQHIFKQQNDLVVLEDIVEFELPFGFLGNLIKNFIKSDITNMFIYRHHQTKNILENKI
ncbi:MAG: SRPBCC family protein [Campylobacterales bacterium]|nr:SRPBCC family protein [Campylobacterales bacterium]